jgi:lipopolysaccharide transport system ATP-binding protein
MTVLAVSHLSKKYAQQIRPALWYGVCDIAREILAMGNEAGLRSGEFWALDDVSFELARGESLAIIGANGAGKSTLLKVLYGLLKPDRGEVRLQGRVQALIELGTGLHPLLTGRENVSLGAALHGLSRREGEALFERVADFADLGDFIDAPLQSYSSGMKARLAYALATQMKPDVLLVDEVLAVGDLAFQRKCATHMRSHLDDGGSLLLVSHNVYQIQSVCERGILLDRGRIAFRGTAVEALNTMFEHRLDDGRGQSTEKTRSGTAGIGPVIITDLRADPIHGDAITTGESMQITMRYRASMRADVFWGFSIWTTDQWVCVAGEHDVARRTLECGEGELRCVIPHLPLVGGRFALRGGIVDFETRQPLALHGWQSDAAPLVVRSSAAFLSNTQKALNQLVTMEVDWQC